MTALIEPLPCYKCGGGMYKEERCIDTSKADLDESCETVWTCESCGHEWIQIINI